MDSKMKLGSLFDGIGGFPLAGIYAGMEPIWASEIEPFPIRVTSKRFPNMNHLGDIHDLNGGEIEPVDVITFGSPCQNLSIAGKRAGLTGKQSSLFFEAVRLITEMREKTNETYPRWAVWENVPGALSSAYGGDFQAVLESLVHIKDPEAAIPLPNKGKWLSAGEIMGDDYSVAWRILDAAKGWGVAQRRRRVFVVVDLDGQRAGQVLFESEGLSRYTPPCGQTRQGAAERAANSVGESSAESVTPEGAVFSDQVPLTLKIRCGCEGGGKGALIQENRSATLGCHNDQTVFAPKAYAVCSDKSNSMLSDNPHSGVYEADTSRTLDCAGGTPACNQGGIAVVTPIAFSQNQRNEVRDLHDISGAVCAHHGGKQQTYVAAFMGGQGTKARSLGYQEEVSPTLKSISSGSNTVPDVVYALQGNMIGRKNENGPRGNGITEEICFTLNTIDRPAIAAPAYCMTVGCFGQVEQERTPTLEARGYKDPPIIGSLLSSEDDAILKSRTQQMKAGDTSSDVVTEPAPHDCNYVVRRLTPSECCRLQGYPDGWCENLGIEQPTEDEVHWWTRVFETWYRACDKISTSPSKARIIKWLKNPRTDAAEYKAYGNSVAVPCVFFVLAGIAWAVELEHKQNAPINSSISCQPKQQ